MVLGFVPGLEKPIGKISFLRWLKFEHKIHIKWFWGIANDMMSGICYKILQSSPPSEEKNCRMGELRYWDISELHKQIFALQLSPYLCEC